MRKPEMKSKTYWARNQAKRTTTIGSFQFDVNYSNCVLLLRNSGSQSWRKNTYTQKTTQQIKITRSSLWESLFRFNIFFRFDIEQWNKEEKKTVIHCCSRINRNRTVAKLLCGHCRRRRCCCFCGCCLYNRTPNDYKWLFTVLQSRIASRAMHKKSQTKSKKMVENEQNRKIARSIRGLCIAFGKTLSTSIWQTPRTQDCSTFL